MIKYILIPAAIMLSCGSTKSNQAVADTDSLRETTYQENRKKDTVNLPGGAIAVIPTCLKNKIDSFKQKELHEQPQKVIAYKFKGKTVYYVVMPCCDFFNEVYDDKCNYLGAPDGGFTGKGDGKLPDFLELAKIEKTVWEAKHK